MEDKQHNAQQARAIKQKTTKQKSPNVMQTFNLEIKRIKSQTLTPSHQKCIKLKPQNNLKDQLQNNH